MAITMANIDGEPHAIHNLFLSEPHNHSSCRYNYCIWGILLGLRVKQIVQGTYLSNARMGIRIQGKLYSPGLIMDV